MDMTYRCRFWFLVYLGARTITGDRAVDLPFKPQVGDRIAGLVAGVQGQGDDPHALAITEVLFDISTGVFLVQCEPDDASDDGHDEDERTIADYYGAQWRWSVSDPRAEMGNAQTKS